MSPSISGQVSTQFRMSARKQSIGGDGEVFGPYLVFERIGVGGMATVHRAKELGIEGFERMVALKRLLPHLAEDEKFVRSFVREAKLASLLQHPNVVQLYELGRVGHVYFISMELIEGRDVRQILRQARKTTGPPPIPLVVEILTQLCDALAYAHTRTHESGQPLGLVHRDVSPSNVIVSDSGHIKVIDFGIAKATSIHLRTQTGRVKGKMAYMSPEAIKGMELDARSDMFSTGVLAHELLTARPLFATKNDYQTLMRVQKATVAPPSTFNRDCPPELDAIVLKALSRDRENRWQSAADMRDALDDMRRTYNLNVNNNEVAAWTKWAFAPDSPCPARALRATTSTPVHAPTAPRPLWAEDLSRRNYQHTPATGPMQIPIGGVALPTAEEDDEIIEIAWGGRSSNDAVPVLLDEVPDVSDKIVVPTALNTGASGATLIGPPPARRHTQPGIIALARGSMVSIDEDEELSFDRVPVPVTSTVSRPLTGPLMVTPMSSSVTPTFPDMPVDDDEEGSGVKLPIITFHEERRSRPATVIGSAIVDRKPDRNLSRIAGAVAVVAAVAIAAMFLLRGAGSSTTAQLATTATATLKFDVEPADAVVRITDHGSHQGSPVKLELAPGEYRIEVSRSGFKSWVSTIEVVDNENQTVRVALEHSGANSAVASVAIRSTLVGMQVSIDDIVVANATPALFDVSPGSHTLAILDYGEVVWRHEFSATANTRYEFHPVPDKRLSRHHSKRNRDLLAAEAPLLAAPMVANAGATTTLENSPRAPLAPLELGGSEPPPQANSRVAAPAVVPPSAVTKISGTIPTIRVRGREGAPPTRISAKLCIDARGRVTSVDILTKAESNVEDKLEAALRSWRYRSYRGNTGSPVPVCFAVGFKLESE